MVAVMMVLTVEMMLMMIPGVMAMAAIPPLREGNSPAVFSLLELSFSLSGFRLVEAAEKNFVDALDVFRSKGSSMPKGSRRGATGARGGPAAAGRPCSLELASVRPFGSVTNSQKYLSPNFSAIWSFQRQVS